MIVVLAVLVGAAWGAMVARRRKGNRLDMAQYAFGYGVALGLAAFFLAIVVERAF